MERLPPDVATGVVRDVQLMNLCDRVRYREMTNATWWKGPIFDTWLKVAYYENSQGVRRRAEYIGNHEQRGPQALRLVSMGWTLPSQGDPEALEVPPGPCEAPEGPRRPQQRPEVNKGPQ